MDWLNKKWLFAFFVIPVVVVLIIFAKWLYAPNAYVNELKKDANLYGFDPTDSIEVFNYDIKKKLELKRYSDNFYIQILNTVITGAKVSYEKDYGSPMPGLLASAVSSITDGLHTDISNPLTYLNIAFTAFSQYDPSVLTYEGLNIGGSVNTPHITDFENAPEGGYLFQ